jgi:hypothetical protein
MEWEANEITNIYIYIYIYKYIKGSQNLWKGGAHIKMQPEKQRRCKISWDVCIKRALRRASCMIVK